jgi:hypothetical protein
VWISGSLGGVYEVDFWDVVRVVSQKLTGVSDILMAFIIRKKNYVCWRPSDNLGQQIYTPKSRP